MKGILYELAMAVRRPVEAVDRHPRHGWMWVLLGAIALLVVPGLLREIF